MDFLFLTYLAVSASDQANQEKITYVMFRVREAMCQGGQGWLNYDWLFW